jgi:hypothetical protein
MTDDVFEGKEAALSWKHCATNFADINSLKEMSVIFIVRHPGSWVSSLYKNRYHLPLRPAGTFAEFLRTGYKTVRRERLDRRVCRPLEIYNLKIASYHKLASQLETEGIEHVFVRFEDIVLSQSETLERLRRFFRNPRKDFNLLHRSTKVFEQKLDDYIGYYQTEEWRRKLDGQEHPINEEVDWQALIKFGYRQL